MLKHSSVGVGGDKHYRATARGQVTPAREGLGQTHRLAGYWIPCGDESGREGRGREGGVVTWVSSAEGVDQGSGADRKRRGQT